MAAESDVLSEIEVLQSIYLDELQVKETEDRGWEVSLVLYPSTAEDSMSQFVRLTLMLTLDQQYPASSPTISIHNPRGLSDDKLRSVQKCLQLEAQSSLGSPVLYQLIEKAKEILTESNIPHGNCVICLYGFKEGEAFTKTSCYHYFHSHCLGRYACHSEKELHQREKELEEDKTREMLPPQELSVVCPVCREPLDYDLDHLLASPAPQLPELDQTVIGVDFQQKWVELQRLWEKQRSRGGIIDLEVESNRFLIHINEVPPEDTLNGPPAPAASSAPSDEAGSIKVEPSVFGPSQRRGGPGHRRHHRGSWQRRGGGSRHLQGQAAAVTERLDKLGLSSDHSHGTVTEQDRGDLRHPAQEHTEPRDPVTVREFHPDDRSTCLDPKHTADSVGSHAPPGRRRGPHRFFRQPSRSRGGVGNHHCRGARFHSGHSRGFQQKVEEMARGREGAL